MCVGMGVCAHISHPHSLVSTVVAGMSVINLRTGVCLFVRVTSRPSQEVLIEILLSRCYISQP